MGRVLGKEVREPEPGSRTGRDTCDCPALETYAAGQVVSMIWITISDSQRVEPCGILSAPEHTERL